MEEIKMIMCDIDGTLLNDHKQITDYTKDVLKQLKEDGILFGIATGRPNIAVENLVKKWGIENEVSILMTFNGGHYKDYILDKEEFCHPLKGQYIRDIIEEYKGFDISFGIYEHDCLYASRKDDISIKISSQNMYSLIIDDLHRFDDGEAAKMLLIGSVEEISRVEDYYNEHLSSFYRGVRSTPNLFEFMSPELSKSYGIARIASNHGWTLDNVCSFGDEMNDIEMIRDCGYGIAMANARDEIKAVAYDITDSNNDNGVANYILKIMKKAE